VLFVSTDLIGVDVDVVRFVRIGGPVVAPVRFVGPGLREGKGGVVRRGARVAWLMEVHRWQQLCGGV
jgi:hypothetical protein